MAAEQFPREKVDNPLILIRSLIGKSLRNIDGVDQSGIEKCSMKLNKKLTGRDLIMPAFLRSCCGPNESQEKDDQVVLIREIIQCVSSINFVKQCSITDGGHLSLSLQRPHITKAVICNVMSKGGQYGRFTGTDSLVIILNPVCALESDGACWESLKIDQLRTLFLSDHIRELFEARGILVKRLPLAYVHSCNCHMDSSSTAYKTKEVLKAFRLHLTQCNDSLSTNVLTKVKKLTEILKTCKYVKFVDLDNVDERSLGSACNYRELDLNGKTCSDACDHSESYGIDSEKECSHILLDVDGFLQDKRKNPDTQSHLSSMGRKKLKVSLSSSLLKEMAKLELAAESAGASSAVLHVVSCKKVHYQEQLRCVWQVTSPTPLAQRQYHYFHGPVSLHHKGAKIEEVLSSRDFLRTREEQLWKSYVLKYGEKVQGPEWASSIRDMAAAAIKLELLSVGPNSEVKVNLSETSREFREATFVLYNCARLAKLFENYEESVRKGLYPALPSVTEVDFGLLRDQGEWELVFQSIMTFPSLLEEAVPAVLADSQNFQLQTNKVSCFLFNLSHKFTYSWGECTYSESRQHLFPTMFARLYMMKAVQQVLLNCLKLLNIKSLTQM